MSRSSKPRVERKHKPKKVYRKHNYREVFPLLMEDFAERCAYSLVHVKSIASSQMQVDHHDARLKKACRYDNLFPAYAVCNFAKSDHPNEEEIRQGLRLLNPCKETEYGEEIFEDPATNKLVATSALAEFHIDILDLNNPALVQQRHERTEMKRLLARGIAVDASKGFNDSGMMQVASGFLGLLKYKIPDIPAPP